MRPTDMVGIAKRAAEKAKDKRPQFAVIRRIDGVRVDLEIGQSKSITKNCEVIGDTSQLSVGQTVQISWWSGDRPVAVAGTSLVDTTERLGVVEQQLAAIHTTRPVSTPNTTGGIADWQILHFSQGSLASVHSPDTTGMNDALAVCASGDSILLPTIELTMDFTVPGGVTVTGMSRFGSVVKGCVTLGSGSALESLRIVNSQSVETEVVAVNGPASGSAHLSNCDAWANNCGAGGAVGIKGNGGKVYASKCYVSGESRGGSGKASSGETVQLEDCKVFSNVEGDANVYGTYEGETQIQCPTEPGELLFSSWSVLANEDGHTLDASTTALTGERICSNTYLRGLGATDQYVFYLALGSDKSAIVTRKPISDLTIEKVITVGGGGGADRIYATSMVVAGSDICYLACNRYSYWDLVKVDFAAETATSLGQMPLEKSGCELWGLGWIARVSSGGKEYVIVPTTWYGDRYKLGVLVYNASDCVEVSNGLYDLAPVPWTPLSGTGIGDAAVLNDHVIFMVGIQPELNTDVICWTPIVSVGIDGTVDIARDYVLEGGCWPSVLPGLDYQTGVIHYFLEDAWHSDLDNGSEIIKYENGAISLERKVEERYGDMYGSLNGTVEATYNDTQIPLAYLMPAHTLLGNFGGDGNTTTYDRAFVVDGLRRIAWGTCGSKLVGIPLDGGSNVEIPITFDRTDPDAEYAYLYVFNGSAFACINYSDGSWAHYLLRKSNA